MTTGWTVDFAASKLSNKKLSFVHTKIRNDKNLKGVCAGWI